MSSNYANIWRQFNIWKHTCFMKNIWRWLVLLLHSCSIFIICSIGCQKMMLLNSQENNIIYNKNINSSSYSHMYEESWNKTLNKNIPLRNHMLNLSAGKWSIVKKMSYQNCSSTCNKQNALSISCSWFFFSSNFNISSAAYIQLQ